MSPKAKARLSGALYLATIVGGIVAQAFIGDRLVVTGDAAATAHNILANPTPIRVAYAIFMIEMACQTAMTAVMYDLLMPVDRSLARTAAVFGDVECRHWYLRLLRAWRRPCGVLPRGG